MAGGALVAGAVLSGAATEVCVTGRPVSEGGAASPPLLPRASAPHPATPANATTATAAGAQRRMVVGSTGGTSQLAPNWWVRP